MKTFMRVAALLVAVFAVTALAPSEVFAKQNTRGEITTVVVIENGKKLVTEIPTTGQLSDEFVLDPGEMNQGKLRRGATKTNIDGIVANMRARMKGGEGSLVSELQNAALGSRVVMDKPSGGCDSFCMKAYRAGDGDVICAGGCRDCQIERCTP